MITNNIVLVKLGRRLNIRQIALGTAEVYLTRFLTKVSLKEINVYLLVTTCLYVASKIEECPQHIRLITSEARNLWPEYIPQDITKVAEFEFYLIEEMDLYLVIHHPYKSLLQLRDYFGSIYQQVLLSQHHSSGWAPFLLTEDELQNSWSIINDSYITDLHLLFPPHIIAITAIYITVVLNKPEKQKEVINSGGSRKESVKPDMHIDDLMSLSYGMADGNNSNDNPGNNNNTNNNKNNNEGISGNGMDDLKNVSKSIMTSTDQSIRIDQFREFLARSHINLDEVVEALQDLINLYAVWNRYNEAAVKKALQYMLLNR